MHLDLPLLFHFRWEEYAMGIMANETNIDSEASDDIKSVENATCLELVQGKQERKVLENGNDLANGVDAEVVHGDAHLTKPLVNGRSHLHSLNANSDDSGSHTLNINVMIDHKKDSKEKGIEEKKQGEDNFTNGDLTNAGGDDGMKDVEERKDDDLNSKLTKDAVNGIVLANEDLESIKDVNENDTMKHDESTIDSDKSAVSIKEGDAKDEEGKSFEGCNKFKACDGNGAGKADENGVEEGFGNSVGNPKINEIVKKALSVSTDDTIAANGMEAAVDDNKDKDKIEQTVLEDDSVKDNVDTRKNNPDEKTLKVENIKEEVTDEDIELDSNQIEQMLKVRSPKTIFFKIKISAQDFPKLLLNWLSMKVI